MDNFGAEGFSEWYVSVCIFIPIYHSFFLFLYRAG